jgi:hypothetical protein
VGENGEMWKVKERSIEDLQIENLIKERTGRGSASFNYVFFHFLKNFIGDLPYPQ